MMLSIFLVAIGLGSGWALYARRARANADAPDPIEARRRGFSRSWPPG